MNKIISAIIATGICSSFTTSVFSAGMGVGTHISYLYNIEDNINCASDIGVEWIREGSSWESVEKEKGVYAINEHTFNGIKSIKKQGFKFLCSFAYGNTLYTPESKFVMPTQDNEEYYNAFLNYVEFQVKELKDYVDAWEVWNEPNWEKFNYYQADGTDYAKLYLDCEKIIRKYDPTAKLICGVVMGYTGNNIKYGKEIFEYLKTAGDVNKLMDAFSIHKYTNDVEGEYVKALNTWESLFDEYGYAGEVWMTENGASSYINETDSSKSMTEEQQATYIARYGVQWERYLMENNRCGEVFWYDLRNDGTDITNSEHNYGLVDYSYNPKPSYSAAKLYNQLTNNKEMISYSENETGYIAKYSDGTDNVYILYGDEGTQNIELSGDIAYVYDYIGNLVETIVYPNVIKTVELKGTPVYVECISNSLKFTTVKYVDDKNILEITGLAPDTAEVIISLEQDGTPIQTVIAKVTEEMKFKKTFSVSKDGNYTLKVTDGTNLISKRISCFRNPADFIKSDITDTVTVYNTETGKGSISAIIPDYDDGEVISLIVVSSDKDVSNLEVTDFVYITDSVINSNLVTIDFKLPTTLKGEYKILLGRKGSNTVFGETFLANAWNWAYVSDINVSDSKDNICVQVNLTNYNNLSKGATVVVAQYSANKLLKLTSSDMVLPAKQKTAIPLKLDIDKLNSTEYVKVFVWDSYGTMIPLCEVK